jgi:hypothetical protein
MYPDYEWKPWRFAQVPKGFWSDPDNISYYIKWIEGTHIGVHLLLLLLHEFIRSFIDSNGKYVVDTAVLF